VKLFGEYPDLDRTAAHVQRNWGAGFKLLPAGEPRRDGAYLVRVWAVMSDDRAVGYVCHMFKSTDLRIERASHLVRALKIDPEGMLK
jgi:hypothetical protein